MDERSRQVTHLVVQHGEGGEALQDARLKEIEEDPHHWHFRAAAFCTQRHWGLSFLMHASKYFKTILILSAVSMNYIHGMKYACSV